MYWVLTVLSTTYQLLLVYTSYCRYVPGTAATYILGTASMYWVLAVPSTTYCWYVLCTVGTNQVLLVSCFSLQQVNKPSHQALLLKEVLLVKVFLLVALVLYEWRHDSQQGIHLTLTTQMQTHVK